MLWIVLNLLRVQQWTKNLIVFAALIFSQNLTQRDLWFDALFAFIALCLASSAIYVLNDALDCAKDRLHPRKKYRPIAAGKISIPGAMGLMMALLVLSFVLSFAFLPVVFRVLLALYVLLMFAYSVRLKNVILLDVMIIAFGFVFRAQLGAEAIACPPSSWFLICTFFLSLFLGFAKRRNELLSLDQQATLHRPVLKQYGTTLLDQLLGVTATLTIITYSIYTMWPSTIAKFSDRHLELTVPFVIFGIFRYFYLVYQKELGGSPERIMLSDPGIITAIVLWLGSVVALVYL